MNTISVFKHLAKDSIIFGGLNALSKFFSIFLTPIFTTLLTKNEYGTMDLLNPFITISGTIIIFGLDSAIARFYYKTEFIGEKKQIISNGFWAQIFISIILVIIFYFTKSSILKFYFKQNYIESFDRYLFYISFIILLSTPIRFTQNLLIWTSERKKYVFLFTGYVGLNFLSIYILINNLENKLEAVFIGQLPAAIIFSIISIFTIRNHIKIKLDVNLLRKMFRYGAPLMLLALVPALIPALDRSFVSQYWGLDQVANYGLGFRIATLIAIPISSINTALGPFILSTYKDTNAEKLFNIVTYAIILFMSFFIILIIVMAPSIINILANSKYKYGIVVVAPLSFYFLLDMLKGLCASGIDLSMKTYWNLLLYPFTLIILYLLLFFLTPMYGIIGASLSIFISSLISFNLFTLVGRRVYKNNFNQFKISILVLVSFLIAFFLGINSESPLFYYYGVALLLLYPTLFLYFIYTPGQRAFIFTLVKKKIKYG